jgi:hypothetical protein
VEDVNIGDPEIKDENLEKAIEQRISIKNIVSFDQSVEQPSIYTLQFSMMISSHCFGIKTPFLVLFYCVCWGVVGL